MGVPHWFKSLRDRVVGPQDTEDGLKQQFLPISALVWVAQRRPLHAQQTPPSSKGSCLDPSLIDQKRGGRGSRQTKTLAPTSPVAFSKCFPLSGPDNKGREDGSEPGFLRKICSNLQDPRDLACGDVTLCLAGPAAGRGAAQTHPRQCQKAQPRDRGGCGGAVRGPLEAGV